MHFLPSLLVLTLANQAPEPAQTPTNLLALAHRSLRDDDIKGAEAKAKTALALLDKELARNPRNASAHLLRGQAHEVLGQYKEAVTDLNRVLQLDPKLVEGVNLRGSVHFKLGQIAESLADFDRFLEVQPAAAPGHWMRGISLYYAGRYDDGRKQFEGYEKVDTNDVENAVWHFLCVARKDGVARARASLLKIGKDARVPMMEVYALFAGKAKPEDVLKAARAGKPSAKQLNNRLFYAHLYLGLYYEATGDGKRALEHLAEAADKHRIGHYMWDVARVHRDRLSKK
jgi:lipoprotein NlpI